jgi:hypothetical protein
MVEFRICGYCGTDDCGSCCPCGGFRRREGVRAMGFNGAGLLGVFSFELNEPKILSRLDFLCSFSGLIDCCCSVGGGGYS